MTKLEVRVRVVRVESDRAAIGRLRLGHLPRFLQDVSILDPHPGRVRHGDERLPVTPGAEFPFARLLGAFGAQDPAAGHIPDLACAQSESPIALKAANTGEDRAD